MLKLMWIGRWGSGGLGLFLLGALAVASPARGLELGVEVNPNPVRTGQPVHVEFTVTNTDVLGLIDVELQSVLPSGISSFSQSLTTGDGECSGSGNFNTNCDAGETIAWIIPVLPPGGSATVSFAPFVSAATGAALTFEVEADDGGPVTASETVGVDAAPIFELALDEDADPVAPGENLTYELAFANVGAVTALGANLTLPVPAGTTFVSASDGGIFAAGTISWALGTLPSGAGGTRQAVFAVDGGLGNGTLIPAEATVTNAGGSATATSVTAVDGSVAPVGLELGIAVNPDPVRAGGALHVELTATNRGPVPASDVVLETRIPAQIDGFGQSFSSEGGLCSVAGNFNSTCSTGERLRWELGTLSAGERVTVSLPPIVTGSTADGRLLPWRGWLTESGGEQALARQTVIVASEPALELAVDAERDPANPDEDLLYSVIFSNASVSTATGVVLRLPLPPGTSFVAASDGGAVVDGAVQWNLGPVTPGAGDTRYATLATDPGLGDGELLRTLARITDDSFPAGTARAADVAAVQSGPALRLGLAVTPDPVRPGEAQIVELTASNAGPFPLVDVTMETRVPERTNGFAQSLTSSGGTCQIGGNFNATCSRGERLQWALGTLSAGERVTVTLPAVVTSGTADGRLPHWRATLSEGGGEQVTASQAVLVQESPALELLLTDAPDPAASDGALHYDLVYANRSASTVTGTSLRLPVPPGTSFVSASDGGALVGDDVVWNLGVLPAGRSGERRAEFATEAALADGEQIRARAAIGDDDFPRNAAHAAAVTAIADDSPLEVALEVHPDPVRPGEPQSVEITVANSGPFSLFDVAVETRTPDGVNGISQNLSTGGGACNISGNFNSVCSAGERLRWTIGELPAGDHRTVTVPAGVASGTPGGTLIDWRVRAEEGGGDQALAGMATAVETAPQLELAADESPDPVARDGDLTVNLTFANRGPGTRTGTTLRLALPEGTSFLSANEGGSLVGDHVEWNLGPVAPGQGGTREATLRVLDPAAQVLLLGSALLRDDAGTPAEARARFVTASMDDAPLSLTIDAEPDPAQPLEALQIDLTVQNQDTVTRFDVVLEARVPDNLNAFSQGTTTGGGICTVSGNLNSSCSPGERVQWQLGNLLPGQEITVSMPPVVTAGTPDGTLLRFLGIVDGSQSVAHRTVRIGSRDADDDGLFDEEDNCTEVPNGPDGGPNDQLDGDADGYGNACDCDFNDDGFCNIDDFLLFLPDFISGSPGANETDMSGDGFVNIDDFLLFVPGFIQGVPGPSAFAP